MYKMVDFRCDECSCIWEQFVDGTESVTCPQCASEKVHRKFPTPMVTGETPYKTLDKYGVPGKKIVSGNYYRSK